MAKWTLDKTAEQKYAEILTLKSKNSKQRAEIAKSNKRKVISSHRHKMDERRK